MMYSTRWCLEEVFVTFLSFMQNLGLPIQTVTLILVVFLYVKAKETCKNVDKLSNRLWEHLLKHAGKE